MSLEFPREGRRKTPWMDSVTPREMQSIRQPVLSGLAASGHDVSRESMESVQQTSGSDHSAKVPTSSAVPGINAHQPSEDLLVYDNSPIQPGTSEDTSRQRSVRAMAAKFESERQRDLSPLTPKSKSRTQGLISRFSQMPPSKALRSTKSISTLGGQSLRNASLASHNLSSRNTSRVAAADEMLDRDLRVFIGEGAALRALELQKAESQSLSKQGPDTWDRSDMAVYRQSVPARKPVPVAKVDDTSMQNPPSLGTMIPYPKKPPVAQHLNLPRPSSSLSNPQQEMQASSDILLGASTPTPRPGSATMLHAQIRTLQRQLDIKTEEAVQLRRQLDAQENSELGTLSQQLREAKQEAEMWKERAEAAERRIQVFEKFTARLRGIRESADVIDHQVPTQVSTMSNILEKDHELQLLVPVTHSVAVTKGGYESDHSGRTEEAGAVIARIRKCLHGPVELDGPGDSPPRPLDHQARIALTLDVDRQVRHTSQSAIEAWMAAQEMMDVEERRY